MSDIVERLRARQVTNWVHATGQTPRASGKRTDPLCAAAADEIERLRAEVAGLREDAERYRHMRNNSQFQSRNGPGLYWYLPRYGRGDEGEQLDAAIDAALAARKGEA